MYIYTRACIVRIRVQNSTSRAALSLIQGSSNSLVPDEWSRYCFRSSFSTLPCGGLDQSLLPEQSWLSSWILLALFLVVAPSSRLSHVPDRACCIFLVSFLNLAPSFSLWQLNRAPRMFLLSFLATFLNPALDHIELRGCLWSRFWSRFSTWLRAPVCYNCRSDRASQKSLV